MCVCVCVASIASMWRKINATRLLKIGCLHVYQLSSGNRIPLYDMPNENDAHLLSVIDLWGHLKTNNKLETRVKGEKRIQAIGDSLSID